MTYKNISNSKSEEAKKTFRRAEFVLSTFVEKEQERLLSEAKLVGVLPILTAVVGTGDFNTIHDSTIEYGHKLNVEYLDIYSVQGKFLGGNEEKQEDSFPKMGKDLVTKAIKSGPFASFAIRNGELVIMAVTPIGIQPEISGYMITSNPIDDKFSKEINSLTDAEVTFSISGKIVSSSLNFSERSQLTEQLSKVSNNYTIEMDNFIGDSGELTDHLGNNIGKIYFLVSVLESEIFFNKLVINLIFMTLTIFIFFTFVGVNFSKSITSPIIDLQRSVENVESSLDYTIRAKIVGNDETASLSKMFNNLLSEVQKNHRQLKEYSFDLEKKISERTIELKETNESMQILLSNLQEGFLVIGREGEIFPGSSGSAEKIFGTELTGKNFIDLIGNFQPDKKEEFRGWLEVLFKSPQDKFDIYASLGPDHIANAEKKFIQLEFKPVFDQAGDELKKVIVIASDRTEEKLLEKKAEKERETVRSIISIINNKQQYFNFINDARKMCEKIYKLTHQNATTDSVTTIMRLTHTVKGLCRSYNFERTEDVAHKLETVLRDATQVGALTIHLFRENTDIQWNVTSLKESLEFNISEFRHLLGDFVAENKFDEVQISKTELANFYQQLQESESQSPSLCTSFRDKFLLTPVSQLLAPYDTSIKDLSKKLCKNVTFKNGNSEVLVNADFYKSFLNSCVHLFSNAIDHGIETPEERESLSKPVFASISVDYNKVSDDMVQVIIRDDGRGIDASVIKRIAIEKGLLKDEVSDELSSDQIIDFIFSNDFSSKQSVSFISGRGIGLASVRHEVEKLGGTISVHTELGQYSEFVILLPICDQLTNEKVQLAS